MIIIFSLLLNTTICFTSKSGKYFSHIVHVHVNILFSSFVIFSLSLSTWLISLFNSLTYVHINFKIFAINRSLIFSFIYLYRIYKRKMKTLRKAKSNCVAPQFNILSYDWWWISSYFINLNMYIFRSFSRIYFW